MAITPAPRGANPFDETGVAADDQGIRRYPNLHESLVEMLDDSVRADPSAEALVEVGGGRLSYAGLWDRAARVSGGLRDAGIRPGDRVAITLPNCNDWVLAFFGGLMAGAIVVPVNTRFTEPEADYVIGDSGASYVFEPGAALRIGGAAVIDAAFDGARMIDTLERERITACTAVPAIYYYILNHPDFAPAKVAGVRWASYGGAPIAPDLVHQIGDRFAGARLANGFGLTECTSIATLLPHEWAAEH